MAQPRENPHQELLSFLLACMGLGFMLLWLSLCTSTASVFAFSADVAQSFGTTVLAFGILGAAARIVAILTAGRLNRLISSNKVLIVATALAAACIPLLSASYLLSEAAPLIIIRVALIGGASMAGAVYLLTCWIDLISRFDDGLIMLVVSCAFFLFALFYFFIIALPSIASLVLSALLPPLSAGCMRLTRTIPFETHRTDCVFSPIGAPRGRRRMLIALLVVSLFFFGIIGQIARAMTWSYPVAGFSVLASVFHELGIFISAFTILATLVVCRVRNMTLDGTTPGIVVLIAVALGIIVPGVAGEQLMALSDFALGVGMGCLQIQIYYLAARFVRNLKGSAFLHFGILYVPIELAGALGPIVTQLISENAFMWSKVSLVAIAILFVLVFVSLIPFFKNLGDVAPFLTENTAASEPATAEQSPKSTQPGQDTACFSKFGLTHREQEVAALLIQGRSLPFIQESLNISEGTAKTHLQHIYQKCGVHNRQDLLSLHFK